MREVKFREYTKDYDYSTDKEYWVKRGIYNPFEDERYDCGQIFMEYTEIKDDDGVEIYEGDILSNCFMDGYKDRTGVVVRGGYAWKVRSCGLSRPLMDNQGWCSIREKRYGGVKVIGNIYENPERVRGGKLK